MRVFAGRLLSLLLFSLLVQVPGTVVQAAPLAVTAVNASPSSTTAGSTVTWSASVSGASGTVLYRFWLYNQGTQVWTMLQDYGPASSVAWTAVTGSYHMQVWAKESSSSALYDAWQNSATVTVSATATAPVRLASVSVSTTSPTTYAPVVISAAASGGSGSYEYRFYVYDSVRQAWTLVQDFSSAASATWYPTQTGKHWAQVWVRAAGSSVLYDDWRNSDTMKVTGSVWSLTLAQASASAGITGAPITWTAGTSTTSHVIHYRFWLRDVTANTWQVIQEYSPSPVVTFSPHHAGQYYVQVWARIAGSVAAWDSWINSAVVDVTGTTLPDDPPRWTVVQTTGGQDVLFWDPVPAAESYMVLESASRAALAGSPSMTGAAQPSAPPFTAPGSSGSTPRYFRVFPVIGGVVQEGGPIASTTSTTAQAVPTPSPLPGSIDPGESSGGDVTPALWDIDGDGCLDLIGRRGNCDGSFTASTLDPLGEALLFATGRVNRDSRFADFTGDGIVDIFTNVYSRGDDADSRSILLVGQGDGSFREDPGVTALNIRGYGETVVAADFDNDGDLDIYLPHYFNMGDGAHSWLLRNNGHGVFTDVAASAGVSSTSPFNPEGAQAIDFNQDGWLDILVATHLYINNHNMTFTDRASTTNVPARFDEGLVLVDTDLDGDLDLVHHDSAVTRLYRNINGRFDGGTTLAGVVGQNYGFGLNTCDINGDGYEDLVVARNNLVTTGSSPQLLLNLGGAFVPSDITTLAASYIDLIACADVDNSGLPDIVARSHVAGGHFQSVTANAVNDRMLRIRVLGASSERNQQGRAVRVRPLGAPNLTLLRFVESGSSYMAQNGYDLLVAAPWEGTYEVSVLFADGWYTTTAEAGDALTIYADGEAAAGLQ